MDDWRIYAIVILLTLSILDIGLTYFYVQKYKKWQPDKPYNMIEKNPILVFLWNKLGFAMGTIVGASLIWTLTYIIAKESHWIFSIILGLLLLFVLFNHFTNIDLLYKLIDKYPSGHLPVETFGEIVGNNTK